MSEFDRITQTPGVMGGKACIRGMRVTVGMIVGQIGSGTSVDELLDAYPYLEREDVLQALRCAMRRGWPAGMRWNWPRHEVARGATLPSGSSRPVGIGMRSTLDGEDHGGVGHSANPHLRGEMWGTRI